MVIVPATPEIVWVFPRVGLFPPTEQTPPWGRAQLARRPAPPPLTPYDRQIQALHCGAATPGAQVPRGSVGLPAGGGGTQPPGLAGFSPTWWPVRSGQTDATGSCHGIAQRPVSRNVFPPLFLFRRRCPNFLKFPHFTALSRQFSSVLRFSAFLSPRILRFTSKTASPHLFPSFGLFLPCAFFYIGCHCGKSPPPSQLVSACPAPAQHPLPAVQDTLAAYRAFLQALVPEDQLAPTERQMEAFLEGEAGDLGPDRTGTEPPGSAPLETRPPTSAERESRKHKGWWN